MKHEQRSSLADRIPKSTELAVLTSQILAHAAELTFLVAAQRLAARSLIVPFAKKSGFPSAQRSKFLFAKFDAKKSASKFLTLFAEQFASQLPSKFLARQLATYVSRSHALLTTA